MSVQPLRVLSLGAGVQSSTLLLMAVHGELQIDRAIFADTQWEPRAVYDWLETLMPIAERAGIPIDVVSTGNIRERALAASTRFASMPLYARNEEGKPGMLQRQCTQEYKTSPVRTRIRELLGIKRTLRKGIEPATVVIGISRDEAQRMRDSDVAYIVHEYPLVDRHLTRTDCVRWLRERGYPEPPKSACIGCPYTDNARWREMRDTRPDEWADAVDFDVRVRRMNRIDGDVYLHRSLIPLPMVDLSTKRERIAASGQVDMFDIFECSPFGCPAEVSA